MSFKWWYILFEWKCNTSGGVFLNTWPLLWHYKHNLLSLARCMISVALANAVQRHLVWDCRFYIRFSESWYACYWNSKRGAVLHKQLSSWTSFHCLFCFFATNCFNIMHMMCRYISDVCMYSNCPGVCTRSNSSQDCFCNAQLKVDSDPVVVKRYCGMYLLYL